MLLAYAEATFFAVSFFSVIIRWFTVKGKFEIPVGISEKKKEVMTKLTIINKGMLPITRIKVLIVVRDVMRGGTIKYKMTLPVVPKGSKSFINNITLSGHGNYELVLKRLYVFDVLGILHCNIKVNSRCQIQVMPEFHDIQVRLTEATKNFYGESDIYDANVAGYDNSELFQIREYRKGDRLQNIHWKLTAKQDELMVKENSLPKTSPVVIFLNYTSRKRRSAYLEIVFSLVFSIMDAGCPHYIVWYDGTEMDVMRMRVHDEESLFYFIGVLMKVKWIKAKENIKERYREKYRGEPYVTSLSLDEKLVLRKDEEQLVVISEKNLEESLSKIELLL